MATYYLAKDKQVELAQIAQTIVTPGKGILVADESPEFMESRFSSIGIENNEENRRYYHQLLFQTQECTQYISAIILCNETFFHKTDDNDTLFPYLLTQIGIIPGITVDRGLILLAGTNNETITQGLDNLEERCRGYKKIGAQFTRWRTLFKIDAHCPSQLAIDDNASKLARYASICQQCDLVPIIEIEVSLEGDHDLETCQHITEKILTTIYKSLNEHHIYLEGTLLQMKIVSSGKNCSKNYSVEQIAEATVITLRRTVPTAVPGIIFLVDEYHKENTILYLNTITRIELYKPWTLSFCYGYSLQTSVLSVWKGNKTNNEQARKEYIRLLNKMVWLH
ncbi:unnamed protein product [Rotaria sp. Silwood1]|nr:unnamed protein product [Rotaria sp. Silwood1]CAF3607380.1 unnamed protein product [Rotaria sp. Silwood1]CAF3661877.1 unnamed protein product [Rotaria sp. Silwood1]CAF4628904.1 unnamed protein product [Rotaria sp. Silwood1]CAF4688269.1 unnamed protein product [Rotaria sp. Silwood1]